MDRALENVQLDFATALLNVKTEQGLLRSLVGDEAKNRKRVAFYRDNLRRMWHRVLASAFPVLRELLGGDFFLTLSREYGAADPAWSGDLNLFGSRMAALLEAWPPTATYRYLADVARLEWLVHRAHFAADAVTLSPEQWVQCKRETLQNSSIRLHPAVELLHTSTRAADRWLAFRDSEAAVEPRHVERPQWIIVARPRWTPEVVVLSPNAFAMLSDLRDGATMSDALDAALARDVEFDFESNCRVWIEKGIVVSDSI
jgi:hypothetical protein